MAPICHTWLPWNRLNIPNFVYLQRMRIWFCSMKTYDWGNVSIHTYLLPRTIGNPHNTQLITILVTLWPELAKFVQKSFKKKLKNWNQINTTFHQKTFHGVMNLLLKKKASYFGLDFWINLEIFVVVVSSQSMYHVNILANTQMYSVILQYSSQKVQRVDLTKKFIKYIFLCIFKLLNL